MSRLLYLFISTLAVAITLTSCVCAFNRLMCIGVRNCNSSLCTRDGHNGSYISITIGWLARATGGQEAGVGDGNAAVTTDWRDMTSAHRYSLVLGTFNAYQLKRACTVNASLFQMKHAIKAYFTNPLPFLL